VVIAGLALVELSQDEDGVMVKSGMGCPSLVRVLGSANPRNDAFDWNCDSELGEIVVSLVHDGTEEMREIGEGVCCVVPSWVSDWVFSAQGVSGR
jgi:hypothetical protein